MEGHKAVLHIGASAHFGGAAQQNTHLPGAYLGKQFFLLHLGLGLMDKSNLLGGHSLSDELLADVLIDGKGRLRLIQRHSLFQRMKCGIVQRLGCLFGGSGLGLGGWKCRRIPAGSACQPRRPARSA